MADLGSIFNTLGTLYGAYQSYQGAAQQQGAYSNAAGALSGARNISPFGTVSGAGGGTYTPGAGGGVNLNYGGLNPAFAGLSGYAGNVSGSLGSVGLPSGLGSMGAPTIGAFGTAAGQLTPATSLAGTMFGGANSMASAAANFDPNAYANSVYKNLTAQAAPWEQLQTNQLADREYGTGTLGSTGGALQTQAFAQGLGTADLQRQIEASQLASQQQGQLVANAGNLATSGNRILSNAFSNFANMTNSAMGVGVTNAQLPFQLQGLDLSNILSGIQGAGGINSLAANNYGLGLGSQTLATNASLGSATGLANLSYNPNAGASSTQLASILGGMVNNPSGKGLLQSLFGKAVGNSGTSPGVGPSGAGGQATGNSTGGSGSSAVSDAGTAYKAGTTAANMFGGALGAYGSGAAADGALAAAGYGGAAGTSAALGSTAGLGSGIAAGNDAAIASQIAAEGETGAAAGSAAGAGTGATAAGGSSAATGAGMGAAAGGAAALGLAALPLALAAFVPTGQNAQWWSGLQNQALSSDPNTAAMGRAQVINTINNGQYTPFSTAQLAAMGVTPQMIQAAKAPANVRRGGSASRMRRY